MPYDFDKVIDRSNTMSQKWDNQEENFPENPKALPFWVADMDFSCPEPIVRAVQERAAHPIYGYSMIGKKSKELAAGWQKKRHNWNVDPSWVTFSNGIVPALNAAVTAYTEPGDGVIIQPPVYYPFRDAIENNGRKVINNPLIYDGEKWDVNLNELERLAEEENNKLLLLCHPLNPVSRVLTKEELIRIGEICEKNHVLMIIDEIHSDLVYRHTKFYSLASLNEKFAQNSITAVAPSKTFNIAGLQMSAIIIPNEKLRERFDQEMERRNFIPNLFGSVAFEAAYSNSECEEYLEELIDYLWDNYIFLDQYLKEHMPKIKCQKPDATYLLWLDFGELHMSSEEIESFCLKEAGLAFDVGRWFGGESENYMRMNIGCPRSQLRRALELLEKAYKKRNF